MGLLRGQAESDPSGSGVGFASHQSQFGRGSRPSGELLVARAIRIDGAVETLVESQSVIVALISDAHRREADSKRLAGIRPLDTVNRDGDAMKPIGEEHLRGDTTDVA